MRATSRILATILFVQLSAAGAAAQGVHASDSTKSFTGKVADSLKGDIKTPVQPKGLSWRPVVIPAALITYGVLELKLNFLKDVNITGRTWASGSDNPNSKTTLDNYTIFIPAVAYYGMYIAGVKGKNNLLDATLMYAASSAIANALVFPLKSWTAVTRPDSSAPNSFPSGHTAEAFVSAEFLRQEYKGKFPWVTAGGYACAIATGYLRMYNNRHWFSDVMAGAGIGIMSTRLSYYFYPKLKNAILGKHVKTSSMIVPTYNDGAVGFVFVHQFR